MPGGSFGKDDLDLSSVNSAIKEMTDATNNFTKALHGAKKESNVELKVKADVTQVENATKNLSEYQQMVNNIENNKNKRAIKNNYFLSEEQALDKMFIAWNKYSSAVNSGQEIDIRTNENTKEVLKCANAYEALGYDVNKIKPQIKDLISSMMEIKNANGDLTFGDGYSHSVSKIKEVVDSLKEVKNAGYDMSNIVPNYNEEYQPTIKFIALTEEVARATAQVGQAGEEAYTKEGNAAEKAAEKIKKVTKYTEEQLMANLANSKKSTNYTSSDQIVGSLDIDSNLDSIQKYSEALRQLTKMRDDSLVELRRDQNTIAEIVNGENTWSSLSDYKVWYKNDLEQYKDYAAQVEMIQKSLRKAEMEYVPGGNGMDAQSLKVLISLLQNLNIEITKISESFAKVNAEGGLRVLTESAQQSNTSLNFTEEQISTITTSFKGLTDILTSIKTSIGSIDDDNGFVTIIQSIRDICTELQNLQVAFKGIKSNINIDLEGITGSTQRSAKQAELYLMSVFDGLMKRYRKFNELAEQQYVDNPLIGVWSNSKYLQTAYMNSTDFYDKFSLSAINNLPTIEEKIYTLIELMNHFKVVASDNKGDFGFLSEIVNVSKRNDLSNIKTVQKNLKEIYDIAPKGEKTGDIFGFGKLNTTVTEVINKLDIVIVRLTDISSILNTGLNFNNISSSALSTTPLDELETKFDEVKSKYEALSQETTKNGLFKMDNESQISLFKEMISLYQEYKNLGGQKSLLDVTDNTDAQSRILNFFEKYKNASKDIQKTAQETASATTQENDAFDSTESKAEKAAKAKEGFAQANKNVKVSAENSNGALNEEAAALGALADSASSSTSSTSSNAYSSAEETKKAEEQKSQVDSVMSKIKTLTNQITTKEAKIRLLDTTKDVAEIEQLKREVDSLQIELEKYQSRFSNLNGFMKVETNQIVELENMWKRVDTAEQKALDNESFSKAKQDYQDLKSVLIEIEKTQNNLSKAIVNKDMFSIDANTSKLKGLEEEASRLSGSLFSNVKGLGIFNADDLNKLNVMFDSFDVKLSKFKDIQATALDSFIDRLNKAGLMTGEVKDQIDVLIQELLQINTVDSFKGWTESFNNLQNKIPKEFTNGFSKVFAQMSNLPSPEGKLNVYAEGYNAVKKSVSELFNAITNVDEADTRFTTNGIPDLNKYDIEVQKILASIKELNKNSVKFTVDNRDGTGTNKGVAIAEGDIKGVEDMTSALKEYANANNYGKMTGYTSNGIDKVTLAFKNQEGVVTKLTGTMISEGSAMRVVATEANGAVGLFGNLNSVLKKFTGYFAMYFTGYSMVTRVFSQFRQGLSTLKDYDSALTTISYTMELAKEGLNDLGDSAIQMAKDLSMSLDDAMSIYQIYANMNTTASEIAETAKPTAILSNLSGVDAATASDQVQGILQQFSMLKDGEEDVAETSMHVVDVLDKISANVAIDYAKLIGAYTRK